MLTKLTLLIALAFVGIYGASVSVGRTVSGSGSTSAKQQPPVEIGISLDVIIQTLGDNVQSLASATADIQVAIVLQIKQTTTTLISTLQSLFVVTTTYISLGVSQAVVILEGTAAGITANLNIEVQIVVSNVTAEITGITKTVGALQAQITVLQAQGTAAAITQANEFEVQLKAVVASSQDQLTWVLAQSISLRTQLTIAGKIQTGTALKAVQQSLTVVNVSITEVQTLQGQLSSGASLTPTASVRK